MAQQWVEDPSLGNIFSNLVQQFDAAPGKALSNIAMADKIKFERAEAARKQKAFDAGITAGEGLISTFPEEVAPSTMNVLGPYVGEPGSTPAQFPELPTQDVSYIDPVKAAQFQKDKNMYTALARGYGAQGKLNEIPGAYAQSQVLLGGVPEDTARQKQLQFLTKGEFSKDSVDNYIAVTPDGKSVKILGGSNDGGITSVSGQKMKDLAPPGTVIMKAGTADALKPPVNPLDSEGSRTQLLDQANSKIAAGQELSPGEARQVALAMAQNYPLSTKIQSDAVGNTMIVENFQEKQVPPVLAGLVKHLNQKLFQPQPAPVPPTSTEAVVPPQSTAPRQQSIIPERTQTVISQAPASREQTLLTASVAQASRERQAIERLVGVQEDGTLPPKPNVPNLLAAIANEKGGSTILGGAITKALDPTSVAYFQAAKRWMEPVMRIASGAAIRPEEYADYYQMFIPSPNDGPPEIANKLNAMNAWEVTIAKARNANEALGMMSQLAQGNPAISQQVERIRVRANEAGTLNVAPADALQQAVQAATPVPTNILNRIMGR